MSYRFSRGTLTLCLSVLLFVCPVGYAGHEPTQAAPSTASATSAQHAEPRDARRPESSHAVLRRASHPMQTPTTTRDVPRPAPPSRRLRLGPASDAVMAARGALAPLTLAPLNVQRSRRIAVGVLRGNQPLAIVDPGQDMLTGVLADQLLILGHQLGLDWQVDAFESRQSLETALVEGRIDIAVGLTQPRHANAPSMLAGSDVRSSPAPKTGDGSNMTMRPRLALSLPYHDSRAAWISRRQLPGAPPPPTSATMQRAFIPDLIADDLFREKLPDDVSAGRWIGVDTQYEGLRDVALGHVDAFLGDPNALQAYKGSPLFVDLQAHVLLPSVPIDYRFAVREADASARALLANIDAALRDQTPRMRADIARHWNHPVPSAGSMRMHLDPTARTWISHNPEVRIAVPRNNTPIAFQNERGQLAGLTASILEMISARTGLIFTPVYADAPDTARAIVARGDADVFLTTRSDAPVDLRRYPAESRPLGFRSVGTERTTRPFLYVTGAIVSACATVPVSDLSALHGKRVGLTRGRAISDFLATRQLHGEHVLFADDERQTLQLVRDGRVDAAIVYLDSASYLLSAHDRGGLCLSGTTGPSTIPIQFGTRQVDTQLARIIDEALGTIPSDTLHAFRSHWYANALPAGHPWLDSRVLSWVFGIGLIIGIGILIWNYKLRQRIRRRHQREAKLNRRIAFLRRLIDANPIPSYVRDADGRMIDCNRAMQQATGRTLAEMRGRRVQEADELDADSQATVQSGYDAIIAGAETYAETVTLRINGQEYEGCHWLVGLRDLAGEFGMTNGPDPAQGCAMLGGWIDMTERKRMEHALRQAKDDAEAANRAKVMFMAAMSHEIRTPMNVIVGVLELMATDTRAAAPLKRQAELAQRCATALMTLLNDLLEFARTEVDALRLDCHAASLRAQIDETAEFYRQSAQQKGLALVLERDASIPDPLVFDSARLRQVMANLLSNAIKFTAAGVIRLRVHRTVPPLDLLQRRDVGPVGKEEEASTVWLTISVGDTGPGIPDERRPLLFQPFQQLTGDTFRRYGGTGMGLAISKRIIEAMQGVIQVDSQEGQGSTFSVTLPFRTVDTRAPRPLDSTLDMPSPAIHAAFHVPLPLTARVLIVDDHEANLLLLSTQLAQIGLLPTTTSTVEDALAKLTAAQAGADTAFDAVITDCNMPVMDGYTLARTCSRQWPELPIIGYSADGTDTCLAHCLDSGMRGRLVKPVTLGMLRAHLPRSDQTAGVDAGGAMIDGGEPIERNGTLGGRIDVSKEHADDGDETAPTSDQSTSTDAHVTALLSLAHDDGDFAGKLIDLFEAGVVASVAPFAEAIQAKDAAQLRDIAHHNKGPASTLGLAAYVDACGLVIAQCAGSADVDWHAVHTAYQQACAAVHETLQAMRSALAQRRPPAVKHR